MKKNILLIDNDDSFTYNLVGLLRECGAQAVVANTAEAYPAMCARYSKILLSPGPELPAYYPNMMNIIEKFHKSKDILGVCLGCQAIGEFFGFKLKKLDFPMHGIKSEITIIAGDPLFGGMHGIFSAGRYHSWALDSSLIPDEIEVTSVDKHGVIKIGRASCRERV